MYNTGKKTVNKFVLHNGYAELMNTNYYLVEDIW